MVLSTKEFVLPPETEDEEGLIERYIKPHPHKAGRAYAYFPSHGHTVAAIIRSLIVDGGNVSETASDWQMPEAAVRAAMAFYRRNQEFIDARILLEDDDWASEIAGPRGRSLP